MTKEHLLLNPPTYKTIFTWLVYNFTRGIYGSLSGKISTYWQPPKIITGAASPTNKYLDQWMLQKFPDLISLKKDHLLEAGCGGGHSRKILRKMNFQGSYTGIDLYQHQHFKEKRIFPFRNRFVKSSIENFKTKSKYGLVYSIAVLEHIKNDTAMIKKCHSLLKPGGYQIHIIPSFWSFFLYPCHAYRQYPPQRIKKLFGPKQLPDQKESKVFRLGGLFSFLLHLSFITIPTHLIKNHRYQQIRHLPIYSSLNKIANQLDILLPICSALYVVIVKKGDHGP